MEPPAHDAAELVPLLRERRLTVLAGAGVSMVPPTGLPSWWELNHAVLDALRAQASLVTPHAAAIIEGLKRKQQAGRMPPEYTSEVITHSIADDYFEVLRCLEGQRINAVHAWLAALARARRLPAIVTTNFDTLIERACAEVGAPLRVLVTEEDHADLDLEAHLDDPEAPTLLLKLHGTATQPTTCIDTLAQRKRGLAPRMGMALRALLGRTRLCVLGYSGADLEAEPNYLYLRQMAARPQTPGLHWLALPGSEVREAVEEVAACFGEARARIVRGTLPGWLDGWRAALEGTDVEAPRVDVGTEHERAEQQELARHTLQQQARAWGAERGPLSSALIVNNLAERVEDVPRLDSCLEAVQWADRHAPNTLLQGIAHLQASANLRLHTRSREALEHARTAMGIFLELEVGAAYDDALAELAHILEDTGQLEDAERLYRQSLEVSERYEGDEQRVMRWQQLAHVVSSLGRTDEALALLDQAHQTALAVGDETARASTLEGRGQLLSSHGRHTEALEMYRSAERVRRRLGQARQLSYNLGHQSGCLGLLGRYDEAHRLLDEARTIAEEIADQPLLGHLALNLASLLGHVGDFRGAVATLRESVALLEGDSNTLAHVDATLSLVGLLASQGETEAAITAGEVALAAAERAGLLAKQAKLHNNLGIAFESSGQLDRAAEHYEQGNAIATQLGAPRLVMMVTGNLANLRYRQGELDDATEGYQRTIEAAQQADDAPMLFRSLTNLANVAKMRERLDEAERLYLESLRVAEGHGLDGLTGHTRLNLGLQRWGQQDFVRAELRLGEAVARLQAQGDRGNAGLAAWYRTDSLLRLDRAPEAKASVEAALRLWEGLPRPELEQARSVLERLETAGVE